MHNSFSSKKINGFTLLELLVVLAIIGMMAGVAIFLATPSSLEAERKKGEEVFNMMQKARLRSMLDGRIYGIYISTEGNSVHLVSLITNQDIDTPAIDFLEDDNLVTEENTDAESVTKEGAVKDKKNHSKTTYERYKEKAEQLGLINFIAIPKWKESSYELGNNVDFGPGIRINFLDGLAAPQLLNKENDELLPVDSNEESSVIEPEVLFFPDGRLSTNGNMRMLNKEGDTIYGFNWKESGEFEVLNK